MISRPNTIRTGSGIQLSESFAGTVEIANYGETSLNEKSISWELKNGKKSLGKGKMAIPSGLGLLTAGTIRLTLPDVEQALSLIHISEPTRP